MRRKLPVKAKTTHADDKKLMVALKRLGMQEIPGVEEVHMFKDDDESCLYFRSPRVDASVQSNTYVVRGSGQDKKISELMPGIKPCLSDAQRAKVEGEEEKDEDEAAAEGIESFEDTD